MSRIIQFSGCADHVFVNHTFEVIFDQETYVFSFMKDGCGDVSISTYQITTIEDGLYQLVFVNKDTMYSFVLNWMKKVITCTYVNEGIQNKVGQIVFYEDFKITNQEKAVDFWVRFFNEHDESAIDMYLSEPYLQHNPTVADGIEAFRKEFHPRFLDDMKECSTEVKRVVSRDDLVFIHNILKRNPLVKGHAAVDIFRFENGRIVEHWDVIQKMPETSKNEHPMF